MALHLELITLARDVERQALMKKELAQAGLEVDVTPGFDYRTSDPEELERHCKPEGPWGVFHKQNMACTISHMWAWERFLETDASHCLVLEDDVHIAPELGVWLSDLSWWPVDADLVKIERWTSPRLKVALEPQSQHRGRQISRLLSRHVGSAGYIMTRDAAKAFIAARPYDISIDNLLFNANVSQLARSLTIYQVHPALVQQGNEPRTEAKKTEKRLRPKGWALIRQKVKRGYYEVAYPVKTISKILTGQAHLEQIVYEPRVE